MFLQFRFLCGNCCGYLEEKLQGRWAPREGGGQGAEGICRARNSPQLPLVLREPFLSLKKRGWGAEEEKYVEKNPWHFPDRLSYYWMKTKESRGGRSQLKGRWWLTPRPHERRAAFSAGVWEPRGGPGQSKYLHTLRTESQSPPCPGRRDTREPHRWDQFNISGTHLAICHKSLEPGSWDLFLKESSERWAEKHVHYDRKNQRQERK